MQITRLSFQLMLLGVCQWMCGVNLYAQSTKAQLSSLADKPDRFQRITAEQAGYSKDKLEELRLLLNRAGSSSMILLYDGKVFFEWGDIYRKHLIHSIRKPMLNALMGIAYDQDKVDLDATLLSLGVDDVKPSLSVKEKQATIAMVLKSRSGVYHDATAESAGMLQSKPTRGSHSPGEFYYYNNWDFNFAGWYYEKQTGRTIYDAFNNLIAEPLGMLHYSGRFKVVDSPSGSDDSVKITSEFLTSIESLDGFYQFERNKSQYPAYHFRLSAHDMALFGQLYLNRGKWKGRQLISESWIDKSTQVYSVTNEKYGLGYGMLWSVLVPSGESFPNSFYHTGVGIHMLGVYPKHKLVMVHRVNTEGEATFKADDLYAIIRLMHGARLN